jgi:flagellar biosynthetic protein FlhB
VAGKPSGEKTEKPTAKRKKDARKDGQIARTNDLGGWLLVLVATWVLPMMVRSGYERSVSLFTDAGDIAVAGDGDLIGFLGDAVMRGIAIMAPMVLLAMLIGVGAQVVQIGWAPKKLKPDLKKLDPVKGVKNMMGPRLLWEAAKNVLKVGAITTLSIGPIREVWELLVAGGRGMSVPATAGVIADTTVGFLRDVALLGLVIAAADYAASKRRTDKQVKMTKQEVKEEHKQQEGDPHVKGQVRARQMAMSRNRMMAQIPSADVVLVNPTHIAVALRYDPTKGAPQVVAKGAGAIADRIRELATESAVPIVRDVPLARTVYRICEIDGYIPTELYEAVARILAFVFTLRARGRAAGTHQSPYADAHQPLLDLDKPRPQRRAPAPAG